jgi:hypothetical protein
MYTVFLIMFLLIVFLDDDVVAVEGDAVAAADVGCDDDSLNVIAMIISRFCCSKL